MNIHINDKMAYPLKMPRANPIKLPKAMTDKAAEILIAAGWVVIDPKELTK